jgi:hypothetical protein
MPERDQMRGLYITSKTPSQHVEAVSRYLMVNLHFEAVQLDEFWSFVKKKKRGAPR